jgi:hypothetical protein
MITIALVRRRDPLHDSVVITKLLSQKKEKWKRKEKVLFQRSGSGTKKQRSDMP